MVRSTYDELPLIRIVDSKQKSVDREQQGICGGDGLLISVTVPFTIMKPRSFTSYQMFSLTVWFILPTRVFVRITMGMLIGRLS